MDLTVKFRAVDLEEFAAKLQDMGEKIGFKVSARGWGYLLEQSGFITKDQFDKVEALINRCRCRGILPVDFVAEEDARAFSGVEKKSDGTVKDTLRSSGRFLRNKHW